MRPLFFILAALPVIAQETVKAPTVGVIDFFGLRKVPESAVRAALPVKEGDRLPASKADIEEALESVKDVVRARLEAVCCENGKAILYVGIEERGAPHFDYLPAPAEDKKLPEEIHAAYFMFLGAVNRAARTGTTTESLSEGHSLLSDRDARSQQLKFIEMAATHLPVLRDVLKTSADEEQRAIAAYVLGYAKDKRAVVNDLQAALRDPDDTVRNNAMRALGAISILASRQPKDTWPEDRIRVQPTWFVEMLDSIIWSDRHAAASVLVTITESRDRPMLDFLRERAMPALAEMARWKHLPHALPGFILLGRAAGRSEDEIQTAWGKGDPEAFIALVAPPSAKPRK